jgi:hypothetical protein
MDAAVRCKGFAGILGNSSSCLSAEATIPQAPDNATATVTTVSSSISSLSPRTLTSGVMQALSKHSDELQAALDKHWEDTLCLLRTSPASRKPTVPPKMLHKFRAANVKTMTKANSLTGRAGGGEFSTRKLKELSRNAEKEAMEHYEGEFAAWNAMDHELPSIINVKVNINALGKPYSPVNVPQSPDEFWQSILPDGCHIIIVNPDGNCFFRSILDQLYHDKSGR